MTMARKVVRPRKAAQKQSYIEPEYDSDYDSVPEKNARPSRHSARLQAAYDDLSNTDAQNSLSEDVSLPPVTRRAKRFTPAKRKTRSATAVTSDCLFKGFKRIKTSNTPRAQPTAKAPRKRVKQVAVSRGVIPPWQALPYQILLKVMKYAAYPLYADTRDTGSTAWLLKTSVLSRSFHEACLGALLFSPPLVPAYRAHGLIEMLKISEEEYGEDLDYPRQNKSLRITIDYRTKIQHLFIETKSLLASKSGILLADLLRRTPVLKSLQFYHNLDFLTHRYVWAHPSQSRAKNKWQYTQFYPVLNELPYHLNLQHFEWNARFLNKDDGLLILFDNFNKTSTQLRGLSSMTLRNFILEDVENLNETVAGTSLIDGPDSKATTHQARLMTWRLSLKEALSRTKTLKRLSICNSNVLDTASISALPAGLESLEIINCPFVNTDGVKLFLSARGRQLKNLVLKGNQYMSIDFMTGLKDYTPNLAALEVDLTYSDPTSFQDTEPLFDSLLPGGPPTWPELLEKISVGPLRKLSAEDAERFYQSLVDASGHLKYLRILEIRTLLNEAGWRDRAALRTKWSARFNEVFNVSCNPDVRPPAQVVSLPRSKPEPVLQSKRQSSGLEDMSEFPKSQERLDSSSRRKSRRIQELLSSDSHTQPLESASDPPSPTYSSLSSSFDEMDSSDSTAEVDHGKHQSFVRQGRCHTVIFELSDQRPAQDQFKENDFIDDDIGLEEDGDFRG